MKKYKIYHNPRCSKSRQALILLQQAEKNIEICEYLKTPPSKEGLLQISHILGVHPLQFTRRKEKKFKELSIPENIAPEKLCELLSKNPELIERPIIIKDNNIGVIGRPPENVLMIL